MTTPVSLDTILQGLAVAYPGTGGAVAVLREGAVLARHSWGYADLEKRLPFTPQSLFRICSISKQFTCSLMLDLFPDPSVLDGDVAARLPLLEVAPPRAVHLAHNQSGLRDYWATAMLCGSPIEAPFGEDESRRLIGMSRTLHFTPGTRYSYCNQNFRILSEVIEARTGRAYEDLLRERVFGPARMATARLCADTSAMPDGTLGYEGNAEIGFRPAVNNIVWTGDAGIGASLDDMIAWEQFIDSTRNDTNGLYRRLSAPVTFADGKPAYYGFGLGRVNVLGREGTGHGGGLRGWRSFRFYLPRERVSVVVLFNHMGESRAAAVDVLKAVLDAPARPAAVVPAEAWNGAFQEPESGLVARVVQTTPDAEVKLHYSGHAPETLDVVAGGTAEAGHTRLRREADGVWMDREGDNMSGCLVPVRGEATLDVAGVFHSDEYDADFTCDVRGGAAFGAFTGFLGQGTMQLMLPVATDLWRLPMPRALDSSPPGDWTVQFLRDAAGAVNSVQIGCWLARRVMFTR